MVFTAVVTGGYQPPERRKLGRPRVIQYASGAVFLRPDPGQLSCPVTDDTPGTFRAVNRGDNAWILGSIGSASRRRHLAGYEKRRKRWGAVPRELLPPTAPTTSRRTLSLINESISLLKRPETSEILKEILRLFLGI
ncbi:hypothetical protein K0M31_012729 [Melipona bicolor]|uniref:Uncharacterized protein n=1 Tax=Melipona bicolor TaxID=60889 RepID=A0AA40KGY1_9HYME|nr:hypothetical protein K0M31_012729 [Melipona bicolor]